MKRIFNYIFIILFTITLLSTIEAKEVFRERIYLQTDHEVYLPGEIIWFKVLTTDAQGSITPLSKIAYIHLLGEEETHCQLIVSIENGTGAGYIQLPADLPTNYYYITAYTRYMRNEGSEVFFKKKIAVINPFMPLNLHTGNLSQPILPHTASDNMAGDISIASDKQKYKKRERGTITLKDLPQDIASLSVCVTTTELAFPEEETLSRWKNNLNKKEALPFSGEYIAEYEGHQINGRLINLNENDTRPFQNLSPVLVAPGKDICIYGGSISPDGKVKFVTKALSGRQQVVTTVLNQVDEQKYRIDLESPFIENIEVEYSQLLIPEHYQNAVLKRSVALQTSVAYRGDSLFRYNEKPASWFLWTPDERFNLDQYTRFPTMQEVIIELIPSLRFRETAGKKMLSIYSGDTGYNAGATLVLLDGVPLPDYEDIFNYDPQFIKHIDIYKNSFIFSGIYFAGIVNFQTENYNLPDYKMNSSTRILTYDTPQLKAGIFVPEYRNKETIKMPLPDLRYTLLWEPFVKTEGKTELDIDFFTSDYPGEFKIKAEAISKTGEIILGEEYFTVE